MNSLTLLFALLLATATPRVDWPDFFSHVTSRGVTYSPTMKMLEGKRVILRGFAIAHPEIPNGVLLSPNPYCDPHEVDETDVPFDAVAVIWRQGVELPRIPARPTVEGTLRLGNRRHGNEITLLTVEDAVPVLRKSD